MAITDRPIDKKTQRPADDQHRQEPFAEIDADHFEQARQDQGVRRFADAADRYFAALKRHRLIR